MNHQASRARKGCATATMRCPGWSHSLMPSQLQVTLLQCWLLLHCYKPPLSEWWCHKKRRERYFLPRSVVWFIIQLGRHGWRSCAPEQEQEQTAWQLGTPQVIAVSPFSRRFLLDSLEHEAKLNPCSRLRLTLSRLFLLRTSHLLTDDLPVLRASIWLFYTVHL